MEVERWTLKLGEDIAVLRWAIRRYLYAVGRKLTALASGATRFLWPIIWGWIGLISSVGTPSLFYQLVSHKSEVYEDNIKELQLLSDQLEDPKEEDEENYDDKERHVTGWE